jgi:outer membrane protein TolC
MPACQRRAIAWPGLFVSFLAFLWTGQPVAAIADVASTPLTLIEVQRLALEEQPALRAEAATIRALREQSVAAAQLPDPRLIAGVMQIPVTGDERLSLRDDDFAALSVGIAQEFPRVEKRRLQAAALEQRAAGAELELTDLERQIERAAGWAWLEVAAAASGARILEDLAKEAAGQRATAEIDLVAGRLSQADVLASTVDTALTVDRARALRQREAASRAVLARWIGAAADRPVALPLPELPAAPALGQLLHELPQHPWLATPETQEILAATELRLADAALKPDWRIEVRYDHRLEFADLMTVMVGVDLPIFAGNRQDRSSSAARARLSAATGERDDRLREATSILTAAYRDWQAGTQRLAYYDEAVMPPARGRVDAALSDYRAGRGSLVAFLDARRSLLEADLLRLDLAVQVALDRLQIAYFAQESYR